MSESAGLFGRWQARREAVAAEAAAEDIELQSPDLATEQSEPLSAAETAAEAGTATTEASDAATADEAALAEPLPDPESIEIGGSFARFMGQEVDPVTRAAALRALWKQPQYNEIDGLIEYALDYSNQPKLSPDASLELAKKVFRYVVDTATEAAEASEEVQSADVAATVAAPADNLPEGADAVSQNGPAEGEQPPTQVV
ncbi:DUF3306 domain-containing protein [Shewanella sp. JM162201]|uniref:DUF3306 domain-containing protein n=1 Tax=Shewanella jiangmenensis TaxID=2837387 RepID=A0ABS5V3M9_9GAMM|nr:DUF3306 domain-containing protein [Shewanella jiangmenensis]MBT1445053.1 DUF3306 domain-containing protein [Shewanella jiangmenensis]